MSWTFPFISPVFVEDLFLMEKMKAWLAIVFLLDLKCEVQGGCLVWFKRKSFLTGSCV